MKVPVAGAIESAERWWGIVGGVKDRKNKWTKRWELFTYFRGKIIGVIAPRCSSCYWCLNPGVRVSYICCAGGHSQGPSGVSGGVRRSNW